MGSAKERDNLENERELGVSEWFRVIPIQTFSGTVHIAQASAAVLPVLREPPGRGRWFCISKVYEGLQ